MFTLLRQRNFALLWFGGLISIMGDWVLGVALPFFVYQVSGSTIATAVMVAMELLPRLLFGSIAGVFVDRWDRRKVMVMTSISQGLVILPLFLVQSGESLWIVYTVTFIQVTLAMFFGPAENALLPLLVPENKLIQANSLNAMNNNFARLIGPPLGGGVLALWGLTGVVLVDSLSFLLAGLMILGITHSGRAAPPAEADEKPEGSSWTRFWKEWKEGMEIVRKDRVVKVLFITVVMLNFGGVMIDPLGAAYIVDVVKTTAQVFGLLVTVQAIGGILGGLLAGKVGDRMPAARLYGWSEIVLAVLIALRYNIPEIPVLFVMTLLVGLPAAMGIAALETLFQRNVPNTHLGRISGALNSTVGITSLFGVLGISGVLGEALGIVPVLNIAAGITMLTGIVVLLFLPEEA